MAFPYAPRGGEGEGEGVSANSREKEAVQS